MQLHDPVPYISYILLIGRRLFGTNFGRITRILVICGSRRLTCPNSRAFNLPTRREFSHTIQRSIYRKLHFRYRFYFRGLNDGYFREVGVGLVEPAGFTMRSSSILQVTVRFSSCSVRVRLVSLQRDLMA